MTQAAIKEKIEEISKRRKSIHVRPTKLMILCFIVEFCNRWALNSINTRYGTYLLDTFQVGSTTFSYILCAQSAWVCIQQAFIYGLVVRTLGLPIPVVALCGILIEIVGYLVMVGASTLAWSVVGSTLLWIGYAFTAPTSTSIISVRQRGECDVDDQSARSAGQSALLEQPELAGGVYFLPAGALLAVLLFAQGELLLLPGVRSGCGGFAVSDYADAERDAVRKDGGEGAVRCERGSGEEGRREEQRRVGEGVAAGSHGGVEGFAADRRSGGADGRRSLGRGGFGGFGGSGGSGGFGKSCESIESCESNGFWGRGGGGDGDCGRKNEGTGADFPGGVEGLDDCLLDTID